MGNDGGSFSQRAEMVKLKKHAIKIDKTIIGKQRSRYCAISQKPFSKPIAMCRLGNLYNYDAVIKCLMDKKIPSEFRHIKKLKDIKKLNFTFNPDSDSDYPIYCPITKLVYNGLLRFVGIWKCGCVISEKAQDLSKSECVNCNEQITKSDVISLNMEIEEQLQVRKQLLQKQEEKKDDSKQQDEKIEINISSKKVKLNQEIGNNILDKLSIGSVQTPVFQQLFHKTTNDPEMDISNLFFRNTRHGLR